MFYSVTADLLVIIHLTFILFVIAGGFSILKWRWMVTLHIPAVAWGAFVELNGLICPLTPWENHLRQLAGEKGYPDSFIEHYLIPIIYPPDINQYMLSMIGILVVVINLCVYTFVVYRLIRR